MNFELDAMLVRQVEIVADSSVNLTRNSSRPAPINREEQLEAQELETAGTIKGVSLNLVASH
jgi:hypothetical protein